MKIAQINATCGVGSTGKICVSISKLLSSNKIENIVFYSSGNSDYHNSTKYMSELEVKCGALEARLWGNFGYNSSKATRRLIKQLKAFDPDIVHLHNVHSHNCNLDLLFNYIKEERKKVLWTFHDCWAFTGSCTYFSYIECDKWRNHCENCPKAHEFSWFFDTSHKLFEAKKKLLSDVNMIIVTPSEWLAEVTRQSFLMHKCIEVINNGIDLSVFKPTSNQFRKKHGIRDDQAMILGVGFEWGQRKGLDIFSKLTHNLPDNYRIVLVGTNEEIDKKIPESIIKIHRTNNQKELAEIYTAADVFVNPTREDNYPTVNMEALACGTPVITFNTGGSPEMVDDTCGIVVEQDDLNGIIEAIRYVIESGLYSKESCLKKAIQFEQNLCFKKYVDLYKKMELA